MQTKLLWKPSNLPWAVKSHRVQDRVWYTVHDDVGNEVFATERISSDESEVIFNDVALTVTKVNGSMAFNSMAPASKLSGGEHGNAIAHLSD